MDGFPTTESTMLLRTDYSDDARWNTVRERSLAEYDEFRADVDVVDDPRFSGLGLQEILLKCGAEVLNKD